MTSSPGIETANPVETVLAWLRTDPVILGEFGGADRVGGENEAPFPRVRVRHSPDGDDGDLRWHAQPGIVLETYGALDGTPGMHELRRLHFVALRRVAVIPERQEAGLVPGWAVITGVLARKARHRREAVTGQLVWSSSVLVGIHPAQQ